MCVCNLILKLVYLKNLTTSSLVLQNYSEYIKKKLDNIYKTFEDVK